MTKRCFITAVFLFFALSSVFAQKDALHFIAIGDWGREGKHLQRETADVMAKYAEENPVKFIATTGDNFYETGIKTVDDPLVKLSFEDIYTANSLQVPWYATLGNHDYGDNAQAQIDLTKVNNRWKMPSRYYSIEEESGDGTKIQFLFIDTNPFLIKYQKMNEKEKELFQKSVDDINSQGWEQQLKWIESSLKNCDADWKVVIGHHPVLSGGKHKGAKELQEHLKPLLEKYGVNMYICGHDHDIQYLKENNVNYFVSGAGSELYETGSIEQSVFYQSINAFLSVKIYRDRALLKFINVNGETAFETELKP
ncbi:MAG: tartrate-resistant acid phosphatase type 5 family protein [Ignavibacteriota bacterium]|nr:tartrate-resistant acid phosphatase type 5 family protein [Ignavibacteriota bacterium]